MDKKKNRQIQVTLYHLIVLLIYMLIVLDNYALKKPIIFTSILVFLLIIEVSLNGWDFKKDVKIVKLDKLILFLKLATNYYRNAIAFFYIAASIGLYVENHFYRGVFAIFTLVGFYFLLSPEDFKRILIKVNASIDAKDSIDNEELESEDNYVAIKTEHFINSHLETLRKKYRQKIYKDDYNNYIYDDWEREVEYFVKHVIAKDKFLNNFYNDPEHQLSYHEREIILKERKANLIEEIMEIIQKSEIDDSELLDVDIESLTPYEYEEYCAELLRQGGWDAKATKASGDQGIDIEGTIDNISVVFQCKKFSQPVGNKAVQEIIAGKQFSKAKFGAVVSNAEYTKSAKQLAESTGIFLLHHDELLRFTERLTKED